MNPAEWAKIATVIADNYKLFDGFVVLHGSDTMSYSASALSFMLENLAKPVILQVLNCQLAICVLMQKKI
jgi:L-asparaginase